MEAKVAGNARLWRLYNSSVVVWFNNQVGSACYQVIERGQPTVTSQHTTTTFYINDHRV